MRYLNGLTEQPFKSTNKIDLAYELYNTSWVKSDSLDIYEWCRGASLRLYQIKDIRLVYVDDDLESFIDALIENNIIMEIH
jgi:hypothetical protein|tara:strand:- start:1740 stop:1982 length:243 start_codon:yes stop_codon:yes gene_type:complete